MVWYLIVSLKLTEVVLWVVISIVIWVVISIVAWTTNQFVLIWVVDIAVVWIMVRSGCRLENCLDCCTMTREDWKMRLQKLAPFRYDYPTSCFFLFFVRFCFFLCMFFSATSGFFLSEQLLFFSSIVICNLKFLYFYISQFAGFFSVCSIVRLKVRPFLFRLLVCSLDCLFVSLFAAVK